MTTTQMQKLASDDLENRANEAVTRRDYALAYAISNFLAEWRNEHKRAEDIADNAFCHEHDC